MRNTMISLQNDTLIGYKNGRKRTYLKYCPICGSLFSAVRIDKTSCSDSCRAQLRKHTARGSVPPFSQDNIIVDVAAIKKAGFTIKHIPVSLQLKYKLPQGE